MNGGRSFYSYNIKMSAALGGTQMIDYLLRTMSLRI